MLNEIWTMNTKERAAIEQAKRTGYLLKAPGIGYQAHETWYHWCLDSGLPFITIGGRGRYRVVIVDLDPVSLYRWKHGSEPSYSLVLDPTPKTRTVLEAIVRRYKAYGGWGGSSYTRLRGIAPGQAENAAQELVALWGESKAYASLSTLWDDLSTEQGITL